MSGVSVGAFNAAFISIYPKGQERAMVANLINMTMQMKQEEFYKEWWGGLAGGLLFNPSLYDNSPVLVFLKKWLDGKPIARMITCNAVDAGTG